MNDWQHGPVRVLVGDVRERLRELPDESVHCVVTSPPYWGLRDYGTGQWIGGDPCCDHAIATADGPKQTPSVSPNGHAAAADRIRRTTCGRCGARRVDSQLGLEATPDEYVAAMAQVFREVRRVLRPDGTLWLNLGDSYAHGGNGSRDPERWPKQSRNNDGDRIQHAKKAGDLKPKDLVGIPWRVAFALQADGWWLRSDIVWSKPNPMPESVTDRPTTSHEHVFLLTRSPRYFYDAEAVREADAHTGHPRHVLHRPEPSGGILPPHNGIRTANGRQGAGRNLRSVWTIATQPYPEAHFATFPEELARRCIAAGTSERGCCPECGAPWRRETSTEYVKSPVHGAGSVVGRHYATGQNNFDGAGMPRVNKQVTTTGWRPTCTHGAEPIPCTVLDPFAGSGTTLAVARRMGRRAVGIELLADYLPLIQRRVSEAALPLLELI